MSNHNVLQGMKCPKCGHSDEFIIHFPITPRVNDEGVNGTPDFEWFDTDECDCPQCGYQGTVGEMRGRAAVDVFREVAESFGLAEVSEEGQPLAVTIEDKQGRVWRVPLEQVSDGLAILANGGHRPADRDGLSLTLWEMAQAQLLAEEHRPRPLPRDIHSLVNELTSALEELRETRNADGSDRIDLDHDTVFDAVEAADKAIERGNEYLRAPKKA